MVNLQTKHNGMFHFQILIAQSYKQAEKHYSRYIN